MKGVEFRCAASLGDKSTACCDKQGIGVSGSLFSTGVNGRGVAELYSLQINQTYPDRLPNSFIDKQIHI
jgi:hypothetical protein